VSIHQPKQPSRLADFIGVQLMAVAVKIGRTRAAKKRNLATLYEVGAVDGAAFQWAVQHYNLKDA